MDAPAPRRGYITSANASEINKKRWDNDPAGVAKIVKKVVSRAGALSPEQRAAVIAALTVTAEK